MNDEPLHVDAVPASPASSAPITWGDPALAPGDSPPRPAIRFWGSVVVFTVWLGFMIGMAWLRLQTTSN